MKRYFSFTLVELLAVTALVALLGAIGFAGYGYAMNASRRAATESLIQQISAGLENFKIKNGYYPYSATYAVIAVTKNSSGDLLDSITFGSTKWTKGTNKEFGVFFKVLDQEKLKKNISSVSNQLVLVDSWGGAIYYKYPGTYNKTGFDLIAPGEDGQFGTNIVATPNDSPTYKDGSEWACDDISNFMDK